IEYQAGVATIHGQIKDAAQRALVTRIVSQVDGVRTVENKLTVIEAAAPRSTAMSAAGHEAAAPQAAASGVQRAVADNQTKSRVQRINHEASAPTNQAVAQEIAKALTSAGLSGYDIEIRYKDGTASLIGAIDAKEQAILAHHVTASVPGVNQVLNRLTLNGQVVQMPQAAPPQGYGRPGMGPQQGMPPQGMPYQGAMPVAYQQQAGAHPGAMPAAYQQPGVPPGAMPPGGMPQYGQVQQTGHHVYNQPQLPNYAWPSYAPYDNSAAISYPTQYDASAFPYIGPYYPYPQVPLGWRKSTLEWDDGQWSLKFSSKTDRWWWFMNPHNWH
ncbi:MAG TPA: BON domain-containing protein, partial [Planctomicrobium sp.]|nr:BON domain-containing protein [Planctomicrobium sp.]